ncbi:hypothetical protein PSTT_12973 [Puccinia striiformis]|uniref:Uncharacterized protein n=1 Tax=Puccinia striiformis TaxID=27350 RepID=A0A2S4UTT8_9BASI|nr:hypothetical protein PSTT_12973 [Puccinia striiformis]
MVASESISGAATRLILGALPPSESPTGSNPRAQALTIHSVPDARGKYIDLDTTKKKGGNEDNTSSSILDLLQKSCHLVNGLTLRNSLLLEPWLNWPRANNVGAQCKSKWDLMQIKYKQIIFLMVNYYGEWNDFAHQVILPTPQWAMVLISSENRETDLMKWADMSFPTFLVMYSLDPLVLLRLTKAVNYVQAGYDAQILPEEESSATIQMRALRQVQLDAGVSEVQLLWAMSYLLISSN